MPSIEKSERRERKRRKGRDAKFQGVRYQTLRAGESLAAWEAERKTTLAGKPPRKKKKGK
ncbi:MAG TPA: hypothetical protein VM409_03545 [Chloroflexia bacterium]|nr:hypothetical protein [Chloroflexia bacterium]